MKVFFASYPSLSLNRGGPTYKIKYLKEALQQLGVEIILYDPWDLNVEIGEQDLFHIFNASISTYPITANLALYGTKYVVNPIFFSNHKAAKIKAYMNLEKPFRKIFKRSFSDYTLTKEVCEKAEWVLPNTKAEGDLLIDGLAVDQRKVKVIWNGVEERFRNSDPELFYKKFGLKDFVLNVGHLGPVRKNGLNMIKALKDLDCQVVIIGDVLKTKEGYQCLEEIDNADNILFLNWVKHDDEILSSAYAACHTFVLPARYETPGRAALEAGLAGANVVITPYGGTREYFEDKAIYTEPHSIQDIKNKVSKALNTKRNDDLKEHITANFTWDKIAQTTLELYKTVIDE
jgi:glycosyltransferase involved in cell wall biosynthesis